MTDTTPLPCPFCNGEAELESESCGWRVACTNVECFTQGPWPTDCTEAEALTAWNTRANADARLVEALREIKHSIGQARILGNDWKRELALIENLTDAALSGVSQ